MYGQANYYRGTTHDQNKHFKDKQKALLKSMKFEPCVANAKKRQVDMRKIKLDVIKPWIGEKITGVSKMFVRIS